jgi:hypothetical protein
MGMGHLGMLMLLTRLYKELGAQGTAPSAIKVHSLELLQVIFNSTEPCHNGSNWQLVSKAKDNAYSKTYI